MFNGKIISYRLHVFSGSKLHTTKYISFNQTDTLYWLGLISCSPKQPGRFKSLWPVVKRVEILIVFYTQSSNYSGNSLHDIVFRLKKPLKQQFRKKYVYLGSEYKTTVVITTQLQLTKIIFQSAELNCQNSLLESLADLFNKRLNFDPVAWSLINGIINT